ncbi:rCG57559 [Rattus norvegicus]|uniref:RCG57559 n=1 Tax=Rattus norvegicus TaxID=10116 RepID=A6JHS9_RAT|nr:rCG57559 [Rattus norvegicus]
MCILFKFWDEGSTKPRLLSSFIFRSMLAHSRHSLDIHFLNSPETKTKSQ